MLGVILDEPKAKFMNITREFVVDSDTAGGGTVSVDLEDRYLDSSRHIRELGEAEEKHQLDHDGVLDELQKAIGACDQGIARHEQKQAEHGGRRTAYILARAAYFAEIHRRTVLPAGRHGGGFSGWCKAQNLHPGHAKKMAKIGKAPDPEAALNSTRAYKARKGSERYRAAAGSLPRDPIGAIKRKWYQLSPIQRSAFVNWIMQQSSFGKQAAD